MILPSNEAGFRVDVEHTIKLVSVVHPISCLFRVGRSSVGLQYESQFCCTKNRSSVGLRISVLWDLESLFCGTKNRSSVGLRKQFCGTKNRSSVELRISVLWD